MRSTWSTGAAVLTGSLLAAACGGRGGRCDPEPYTPLANTGCGDAPDGVVIEDAQTFLDRCGVEAQDEDFEPISFDEQVALSLSASGTGCTVEFEEDVCRNDRKKVVTYSIFVRSIGTCDKTVSYTGWLAIDRPEPGWTVEFEVREL